LTDRQTAMSDPIDIPDCAAAAHPHRLKQKFTPEEDNIITSMVQSNGAKKWRLVAEHLNSRTARQCRERWINYLSPCVTHAPWTSEEDSLLREKVSEFGPLWSRIARLFEGRTDIFLKHRYLKLMRQERKALRKISKDAPPKADVRQTELSDDEGGAFWVGSGNDDAGDNWEYFVFDNQQSGYGELPSELMPYMMGQ
jgi:hypothetical protein